MLHNSRPYKRLAHYPLHRKTDIHLQEGLVVELTVVLTYCCVETGCVVDASPESPLAVGHQRLFHCNTEFLLVPSTSNHWLRRRGRTLWVLPGERSSSQVQLVVLK